jgi:hypothetical protein
MLKGIWFWMWIPNANLEIVIHKDGYYHNCIEIKIIAKFKQFYVKLLLFDQKRFGLHG